MAEHLRRINGFLTLAIVCCVAAAQVPGTGRVQIKSIQSHSGGPPLTRPTAVVVYDFAATPEEVKLNSAVLNRVRMQVSGAQEDEKAKLAHKIASNFSESLIKDLQRTGVPVSKGITGMPPPDNSLAVQGDFLLIDEGNRARRTAIGLGVGASKVETHVECYLNQLDRNVMVTEFTAISRSSRKPGAAETMGAGAAPELAVGVAGATELKQGAEGDIGRMAKAVAKQITKTMVSQGWVEAKE